MASPQAQVQQQQHKGQGQHQQALPSLLPPFPSLPSLSTTMNDIVVRNNQGIHLLRSNSSFDSDQLDHQLDDALAAFASSLSLAKQSLVGMMKVQQGVKNDTKDYEYWFNHVLRTSNSRSSTQRQGSSTNATSTFSYVYQDLIELPLPPTSGCDNGGMEDDAVYKHELLIVQCICIMYNLALSFHLKALLLSTSSSSPLSSSSMMTDDDAQQDDDDDVEEEEYQWYISSAIDMYELCYEMMGNEQLNPGLYFIMILANNLGHCHSMLASITQDPCHYNKAKQCMQHLLSIQVYLQYDAATTTSETNPVVDILMTERRSISSSSDHQLLHQQREAGDNVSSIVSSPWEGFMHNTSRLMLQHNCASAA